MLEGYSEFIYQGEKHVQMPKRVFEAEMDKSKKMVEQYRKILKNLKAQLNVLDLD